MSNIRALNQYENQLAFAQLESLEFNPNSKIKVEKINLDMNETADDVVMINAENSNVNAKEGNNTVCVSGKNNSVKTGNGNNVTALWGSKSKVSTGSGNDVIYLEGENLSGVSASGNNLFRIYGDNNSITTGNGNNEAGILGSGNRVSFENGNQTVGFYGNNNVINMNGYGRSSAMTLDYALLSGKFSDMEDKWLKTMNYFNSTDRIVNDYRYNRLYSTNPNYTALSDKDMDYADTIDLQKKVNGHPKYVIGGDDNGYAVIYEYSYTYNGNSYYYTRGNEGIQSKKKCINKAKLQEVEYGKTEYVTFQYNKNYQLDGVSGNIINMSNGDNTVKLSVADGTNNVSFGTAEYGHVLEQKTGYTFADVEKRDYTDYQTIKKKFYKA